jgi:hypothetical protein
VLVQIGLLDASTLPVAGLETAAKMRDPQRPSNALMARAERGGPAVALASAPAARGEAAKGSRPR